jgi:hypothetical protein
LGLAQATLRADAFPAWSRTIPRERGRLLARIADALEARVEELARTIALETGNALRTQGRPEAKTTVDKVQPSVVLHDKACVIEMATQGPQQDRAFWLHLTDAWVEARSRYRRAGSRQLAERRNLAPAKASDVAHRKDVKYQGQSFIQQTTLAARSENLVGLFAERT